MKLSQAIKKLNNIPKRKDWIIINGVKYLDVPISKKVRKYFQGVIKKKNLKPSD